METVVISGSVLYISLTLFCFSHAYIVLVHHLSYLDLFIYFKSILRALGKIVRESIYF